MPRPYPPPPVPSLTGDRGQVELDDRAPPFNIDDSGKRDLARVLGLPNLPQNASDAIAEAIACYKATENGSRDTTVGNTLAALHELEKKGAAYRKAVKRLSNDRSGVDDITLDRLQPLAKAVLRNQPGASEALAQAARARAEELRKHKRVQPETEALRVFCGFLRKIFNRATAPEQLQTDGEGWRHCRRFAIEVLRIADIQHDFESHPDRLKEYLGTDVA